MEKLSDTQDQQATSIARRIRTLRESQRMSQRDLARASGLSPNTLSLIERDQTSPTAGTLLKLANALGVSVTLFFQPEETHEVSIHITREGERTFSKFASGEVSPLGSGARANRAFAPALLMIEPHGRSGEYMVHRGQEFVYCVSGRITYDIEGQVYDLQTGDTLLFDAELAHRWHNPDTLPTEILMIHSAYKESDIPAEHHLPQKRG
jgi:transcriptional regulator with XRE-family HTH domain